MMYDDKNGRLTAKRWKLPTATLSRWKRLGIIPDYRAMGEPLDKVGLEVEQRLLRLVESGWLKGRPVSRLIGSEDKINALLTARRYPDDSRYHVYHLKSSEIKRIKLMLDEMQRTVGTLLYLASITPADQNHNEVVQADLRVLLHLEYLSTVNVRLGMDKRQVGRFWGFMRGGTARREDFDLMIDKLKLLGY